MRVNGDPIDPSVMDTSAPPGWDAVETPFRAAPPAAPKVDAKPARESGAGGAPAAEEKKSDTPEKAAPK